MALLALSQARGKRLGQAYRQRRCLLLPAQDNRLQLGIAGRINDAELLDFVRRTLAFVKR
jgi:hypothetical protein